MPLDPRWAVRFAETLADLRRHPPQIVLLGDSIIQWWPEDLFNAQFPNHMAANLGSAGDRTENLLWRLQHSAEFLPPAAVYVILIGTNNLWDTTVPDATADGVRTVITELRRSAPKAHIILLGILPRAFPATDPVRDTIRQVNARISTCAQLAGVIYADIGDMFLLRDGDFDPILAHDALHPTAAGYQRITPRLMQLIQQAQSP